MYELLGKRVEGVSEKAASSTAAFKQMLTALKQQKLPLPELIEQTIIKSGYRDMLMNSQDEADLERLDNVFELVTIAEEKARDGFDLAMLLEHIALLSDIDQTDSENDAVTLMTLHSAKGLEYSVVFLTGMEETILPHFQSLYSPEQLEEERRLCYVGMTRAKTKLFLSSARQRSLVGETRYNIHSRFIDEVPEKLLERHEEEGFAVEASDSWLSDRSENKKQINSDADVPRFAIGEKVFHNKWGKGQVLDVITQDDEQTVDIQFMRVRKTLMPKYAKLDKV